MITEYSPEFKESMLQKIFFNPEQSVVSFAREANIPGSTVATWVRNYKKKNGKIMGQKKRKELWSAEKMFETVLLTAPAAFCFFRKPSINRSCFPGHDPAQSF